MFLSMIALLACVATSYADEWEFDDQYEHSLLFIHPLINYQFHPLLAQGWERNLVRSHGIRIISGSVSTDELYTALQVNLNPSIGHGFRFLYIMNWIDGLHLDARIQEQFVGFEKSLVKESGLQLLVQPTSAKEYFDLLAGVLLTNETREQYLRLWIRFDDFIYEQKNDRSGFSKQESIGPQWALRLERGSWQLFSEGHYSTPSERFFRRELDPPEITEEKRNGGESVHRLRYKTNESAFLELEIGHSRFEESLTFGDSTRSYAYQNEIWRGKLLAFFPLGSRFRGRAELHYLEQEASAQGRRDYGYSRQEVPWAVFGEWLMSPHHTWEVGYMASHYEWDYRPQDTTQAYDNVGTVDKLKLAWTFNFSPTASLQLSLSHEPQLSKFGGFAAQSQIFF